MWEAELREALRENLSHPRVRALAVSVRSTSRTGLRDVVAWVRKNVPYRYDGPWGHRIGSLSVVEQRGYGACGDGAAIVGAVGILRGIKPLSLCIEAHPNLPLYGHVRIVHRGSPLEPWPEMRWEVPACSGLVDVQELLVGQ